MPLLRFLLAVLFVVATAPVAAREPLRVFAAVSLTEAMNDIADLWAAQGHRRPVLVLGASSALARQIEAGAPADLFVSADTAWMDHLATRRLIADDTRRRLAGNRLVLAVPAQRPVRIVLDRGPGPLRRLLDDGRLAIADPDAVPAGRYARAALISLGHWRAVAPKLVRTDSVRSALAFVERGEAAAAIVYATDARASRRVRIAAAIPAGSHPTIVYPVAATAGAGAEARSFIAFLGSAEVHALLRRRGFVVP